MIDSSEDCTGSLGDKTLVEFCALLASWYNVFAMQFIVIESHWNL